MVAGNQQPPDSEYGPPSHSQQPSERRTNTSTSAPRSSGAPAQPRPLPSTAQAQAAAANINNTTSPSRGFPQYSSYSQQPASSSSSVHAPGSRPISPTRSRSIPQESPPQIPPQPQPIRIRDLAHIVELTQEDARQQARSPQHRRSRREEDKKRYEISSMPVGDVIEMVARLLTKITTTNDRTHQDLHRNMPSQDGSITGTSSSILAFHGKNVPSITIQSYLSRIHKYCPTSYEVFLSLLVYFDRMTEKVNQNAADWRNGQNAASQSNASGSAVTSPQSAQPPPPPPQAATSPIPQGSSSSDGSTISGLSVNDAYNMSHFFVVDSFNIHRLVIAGVTCASKFFSDIFYTNSRYAKVGGLPLVELNHLELQFLILNDFRLAVPVEELEAYGTMLVSFYGREVVSNAELRGGLPQSQQQNTISQSSSQSEEFRRRE
ncbi:cyclin-domain-containing protein [Peziza echinospora]|nr:cyclin-domain-containing protein [Peziza echinospora]